MSAGMAEVIAAHWAQEAPSKEGRMFALLCQADGCGWGGELLYTDHAAHVAEELAKAGYGDVQEAGAEALRAAAAEAHVRGDVGKEDRAGTPVEAFLEWRARLTLSASPYEEASHGVD